MTWRSVVITKPSYLKLKDQGLVVVQNEEEIKIPLEDIAVLLIDNPQVTLSSQLLSACASQQVTLITVGADHHPNGVLLPFIPHSRALKVIHRQINMGKPHAKRLWQQLVIQKIINQAHTLQQSNQTVQAKRLRSIAVEVKSGDSENLESIASQVYFPALFGMNFNRRSSNFVNAALNYCYAILRAALARHLVAYGFITALGLHHCNQQNSFNLADDLIEPFRAIADAYVLMYFEDKQGDILATDDKAFLVNILNKEVTTLNVLGEHQVSTMLVALEAIVISLSQCLKSGKHKLHMPLYFAPDTEDE